MQRRRLATLAAVLAVVLTGCGKKGSPLAPLSRGPLAPLAVSSRQLGRSVLVGFEVPGPRGPRPSQQIARAELVRVTYPPGVDPVADADAFRRRGETVATADELPTSGWFSLEDPYLDRLEDRGIGRTLRYAVRLRDRRGRPSVLAVARDLVPLPPEPAPTGLRAEPTSEGVRLQWVSPSGGSEQRFNLYRSAPGEPWAGAPLNTEPLAATEYLDRDVTLGRRYAYVVRVALASQPPFREGESSAVLEVVAEDRFAPEAPTGLVAVQEGRAVRLFWNPNHERDMAGYRLYRRRQGQDWQRIGPDPVEEASYVDREVQIGEVLGYRIHALDRTDPPNESPAAAEVEIELLAEPVVPGEEP